MERLLENRIAIVTGGSRALGFAIASALVADGARVLIVSRSEQRCRDAVALLEKKGTASGMVADITMPGTPAQVIAEASERFGGLDILVNAAGVFVWKKLLELTPEDWSSTIATNLTAPFFMMTEAAKVMIEQGRGGSMVNITSIHGSVADPNVAAHCASKFGLEGLTRSTAEALREFDIRVNAVAPGSIEADSAERRGETPRKKVTQADVASLVVYLASDLSRSITGATLDVFGSTRAIIKA